MYSKVSKYSPEARKRMTYRSSKGKSCGYYMKIVFFFSSLIQSLIIVSLVLFLVYGKQEDTASVARVQDLELRFSQLSLETVNLRQQRKNLTHLLNLTSMERARNEWDLAQLRFTANISYILLDDMEKKLKQCNSRVCPIVPRPPMNPFPSPPIGGCSCGMEMETLKAKMQLVHVNFTQTAMQMQMEMDQISRERDNINLEAIQLRRDKFVHEKAIEFYQMKCKEEFVNSLSGISNVSKAFLTKIDSLFHALSPFHLTCPKQKDYLDQIRNNCTDLSEEVVTKFQAYLDTLGSRVSMYQGNISVLTAENQRMTRDYNQCSQNRSGLIREHKKHIERIQLRHDEEKKTLLNEKIRLNGNIVILESSIKLKNSQLEHMNEQLKHLNLSCIPRTGGLYPRPGNQPFSNLGPNSGSSNHGFPSSNSGLNQFNQNSNFGSSSSSSSSGSSFGNLGFNKPSSPGLGTSSLGSNSGSFFNKPGSSNQGSSSSFGSTATGLNKPASTGLGSSSSFGSSLGSSGTGLNKPASTGLGSSSSFGSSLGSSGTGLNKPTSNGLGSSSSFGSSLGSSGTGLNKPSSTGQGSSLGSSNNPSSSSSSLNRFGSGTSSSSSLGSKFGSSTSSLGSNFGSSNSGLGSSSSSSSSKTTTNSRSSSNTFFGSSSSSSGSSLGSSSSSQNKLSSSSSNKDSSSSSSSGSSSTASKNPFGGWFGLGGGSSSSSSSNSNSDQSKLGSNQGRGPSTSGTSFGSFGPGRTNTFSFTGPISVNQHLRDLQRIINPPGPEEKQELSRIMG